MDQLPNELLLKVLAFLDGASLVRCKRVCKQWQIVVTAILTHGKALWRLMCLSEIDRNVVAELQSQRYLERDRDGPELDWFKTYRSWYCSSAVSKSPHSSCEYSTTSRGEVTCLKASGDLIVTGHVSGFVVMWHAQSGEALFEVQQTGGAIADIALLCLRNFGTLPWGHLGCVHSHMVCAPQTLQLQVYRLESDCRKVHAFATSYPVTSLKACGDLLATLSTRRCLVVVMRVTRLGENLRFQQLLRIPNQMGICSWIGISHSFVMFVGPRWEAGKVSLDARRSWKWGLAPPEWRAHRHVMHALVQRRGFVVISTVDMRLYVSMDECHDLYEIKAARDWNSRASALALWGELLVIGLESGQLYVFYMREDSLDDLASRQADWSEQLGTDPIINIDVTSDPRTSRPTLVAATRHKLHVITWPVH